MKGVGALLAAAWNFLFGGALLALSIRAIWIYVSEYPRLDGSCLGLGRIAILFFIAGFFVVASLVIGFGAAAGERTLPKRAARGASFFLLFAWVFLLFAPVAGEAALRSASAHTRLQPEEAQVPADKYCAALRQTADGGDAVLFYVFGQQTEPSATSGEFAAEIIFSYDESTLKLTAEAVCAPSAAGGEGRELRIFTFARTDM